MAGGAPMWLERRTLAGWCEVIEFQLEDLPRVKAAAALLREAAGPSLQWRIRDLATRQTWHYYPNRCAWYTADEIAAARRANRARVRQAREAS